MTTSIEPTSVIQEALAGVANFAAQSASPVTVPCPDWCTAGPHTQGMPDGAGAYSFNHEHTLYSWLIEGVEEPVVYVCQPEIVHADGSSDRTPAVLYVDMHTELDDGEVTEPHLAVNLGMGVVQAATLLKDINGGELTTKAE